MEASQVDEIIERLLEVKQGRPGKQVQLAENEIRLLCLTAKEIFMSQPNLLELEAPIKICGAWAGGGQPRGGGRVWGAALFRPGLRHLPAAARRRHPRAIHGPAPAV